MFSRNLEGDSYQYCSDYMERTKLELSPGNGVRRHSRAALHYTARTQPWRGRIFSG